MSQQEQRIEPVRQSPADGHRASALSPIGSFTDLNE